MNRYKYGKIVNGSINLSHLTEFIENSPHDVSGDLIVKKAIIFIAKELEKVGHDLDARNAKKFIADELQNVGWTLYANNATEISIKKLKKAQNIYVNSVKKFTADNLENSNFIFANCATEFITKNLQDVYACLHADSATVFIADKLQKIGWNLHAKTVQNLFIPKCEIGNNLYAFNADKIDVKKVNGTLYCKTGAKVSGEINKVVHNNDEEKGVHIINADPVYTKSLAEFFQISR